MAETFTDKLKLTKRDTGDFDWGTGNNANLDLLDAHAQQGTLRSPRTLLATLGSGAVGAELLGNTIYFYKVTAINTAGETTENKIPATLEAQVSQPSTPLPIILQWETVKGASGYRIYKSTATGQERFLVEVTGETMLSYIDTGNVATNNLISVPTQNTARTSVRKIVAGSGINVNPADGTGDVTVSAEGGGGVTSLKKTGEATSLVGDVSLEQGDGMQLTQDDPNDKIVIANAGVTGVRKLGEVAPLTGDVKLEAGANISLTQDGPNNKVVIAAGGGGVTSLKKTGEATALTGAVSLEQGAGMQLTQDDPNDKILIANAGVTGIRKLGEAAPLSGDVKLEAGTNITLTQDGPNNKITIAAAAGGGTPAYATQVVAVPTGVAATDTSNIQTALNNAGTVGGGTVQLREGTYVINNTLTIPAKVTLQGVGRDATIILCDASMGAVFTIAVSGNSQGLRDLKIDENQPNRTGGSSFVGIYLSGTNALVENCWFVRNKSNGSWIYLATGGQMRNCIIDNNGNGLSTAMVQGGELIDNCQLNLNQNNGSVLDFFQSPGRVSNCRLVRTMGTLSGAGMRLQSSQQSAVGNMISVSSPNKAVIVGTGTTGCVVVGNTSNGATILLETNANSAIVVGNSLVVVTNNSGTGTNQIANNS